MCTILERRLLSQTVIVYEDHASFNHGLCLWSAGDAFVKYLESSKLLHQYNGCRVLELGAGTGLVSMLFALAGAIVVATDLPSVVGNLNRTVAANDLACAVPGPGKVCVRALDWRSFDADELVAAAGGPVDAIVGTDVVYQESLVPVLLDAITSLCVASKTAALRLTGSTAGHKRGGHPTVYLANEERCSRASQIFTTEAASRFRVRKLKHTMADVEPGAVLHLFALTLLGSVAVSGGDRTDDNDGEKGDTTALSHARQAFPAV
jgi:hypothetical protein